MIKVIYVIPKMELAGTERHLYNLVNNLNREKFSSGIICTWKLGRLGEKLKAEGFPIKALGYRRGYDPRLFLSLLRIFQKRRPHILHTYLFGFHLWACLPGRMARVPVIITSRRELAYWMKPRHLLAVKMGNYFMDKVVACSQAVKDWTVDREGVPPNKIEVIYNGIDSSNFQPRGRRSAIRKEFSLVSEEPLVGMIANFYPEKGHKCFLMASKIILEKHPPAKFLIVGEGLLRREVENEASHLGLDGRVIFTGLREDVPELLEALDVVVIPSLAEGLPNVLLEAMAASRPIVASEVGGVKEVIQDGETGILVPPSDYQALAKGIIKLLENPEKARTMVNRAHKLVEERFSLPRMVKEYERLYEGLLEARAGGKCG